MLSHRTLSFQRIIRVVYLGFFLTSCASAGIQPTLVPTKPIDMTIPVIEMPLSVTTQLPLITAEPVALPPAPLHSLLLEGQLANTIALDSNYIYWTMSQDPKHIFRYPLAGGEKEIIATTQFPDGDLSTMIPIRSGDWLIFLDTPFSSGNTIWKVRALNLKDNSEQVVVSEDGDPISWPGPFVAADGDWVAWTRTGHSTSKNCDQSILAIRNLKTGEERELERICTAQNYMWIFPSLSGDKLVVEQDLPDDKGLGNNIYLFDLTSGMRTPLTNNGHSSVPVISGNWIVWKAAPRFASETYDMIYNLQGPTQKLITAPGQPPNHLITDHWLYWLPSPLEPFYVYDLTTENLLTIIVPGENESIHTVAVSGTTIAWCRDLDYDKALPKDTILEWRTLP